MLKPLITGITALSLMFATVAPATAEGIDRDDVGTWLIGLAAVAALNAVVENSDRDKGAVTDVHDRQRSRERDRHNHGHAWGLLNRHQNRFLPWQCLRRVETRFGVQRMFDPRCLARHHIQANRLPDRCRVRIYTHNGPSRGYDPMCLRSHGYRLDRRW